MKAKKMTADNKIIAGVVLLLITGLHAAVNGGTIKNEVEDATPEAALTVVSYSVENQHKTRYRNIRGIVRNNLDVSLRSVAVVAECKNREGRFITKDAGYIGQRWVLPGQEVDFVLYLTEHPDIHQCYVSFVGENGARLYHDVPEKPKTYNDIEDALPEWIADMQRYLNAQGHNAGTADGVIGPKTMTAMMGECGTEDIVSCAPTLIEAVDNYRANQ